VLAGLVTRTRVVVVASGTALVAFLIWAAAPSTGQPDTPVFDSNVLSTVRYALPALAVAALAVALAANVPARAARVPQGVLVLALAWNLVRDAQVNSLDVPGLPLLALAALLGAAIAAALGYRPAAIVARRQAGLAAAAIVLLVAALLSRPATGVVERHVNAAPSIPGTAAVRWALSQPGFDDAQPIYFAGPVFGQLTGDGVQHRLVLLKPDESCAVVRDRAANGVLVVGKGTTFQQLGVRTPAPCLAGLQPTLRAPGLSVYGAFSGGANRPDGAAASGIR
jgi:hypothetical protein